MPRRQISLETGKIYHIFNRGVAKLTMFRDNNEYQRFSNLIDYYRFVDIPLRYSDFIKLPEDKQSKIKTFLESENKMWVEIYSFILMPNHFHLCLRQLINNGISNFLRRVENSFTHYVNIKNERVGPQFQGRFKSILVETDEQLLHLSRYQHLNIYTDGVVKTVEELINYPHSSLTDYIKEKVHNFIDTELILSFFKNRNAYKRFVLSQRDYQRKLGRIKKLLLEKD